MHFDSVKTCIALSYESRFVGALIHVVFVTVCHCNNPRCFCHSVVDSDGDEMQDDDDGVSDPATNEYRIWFAVEINVEPQPPESTLFITSPCQVCIVTTPLIIIIIRLTSTEQET